MLKRSYSDFRGNVPQKKRRLDLRAKRAMVPNRVPRAIATRGTPKGYYELPISLYTKIYWNNSTGFFQTDQTTGASSGGTGYAGIGIGSQMDNAVTVLGVGSVSQQINQTIPGYLETTALFDVGKIAYIDYEVWFSVTAPPSDSTVARDVPELWLVRDFDSVDPPGSLTEILQYNNIIKIRPNANMAPVKFRVYPKIKTSVGSSLEQTGTTTTLAGSQGSIYMDMDKPAPFHFGLRGWLNISTAAEQRLGYVHIVQKQVRRFKHTK